jgi:hypothetical protein
MSRLSALAFAIGVFLIGAAPLAETSLPPNVKKLGTAIVEYRDAQMHAAVAYEYSHRYHDGAWLFVDAAVRTAERLTFHRSDFRLVTSNETGVGLASEEAYLADAPRITLIRQNAGIWNRSLSSYFTDGSAASFQFFALPGESVVTDSIVTNTYGPALVTLYFKSAESHWPEGTYHLRIDNGRARAELPIVLK